MDIRQLPQQDNVLVTGQPLAGPVDQRVSALVEKRDDA